MSRRVCSPRIAGFLFVALVVMPLSSTFVLAHNPQASDLADNPAVAAQLQSGKGKPAQVDGELEIVHQDFPDGHGRFVFTLKQADGTRVPMQFAKHPPTHLLTGDHVRANGQLLNGNLLLYSGGSVKQTGGGSSGGGSTTPSIPVPNTFGTQSVLVILVNFQDDAVQPYTLADAQDMFFSTANRFFAENSYQQTTITGGAVGWYTIPDSVSTCDTSQIATDAQTAAISAGIKLSNYSRYVYAFPQNSSCGFSGASYVGGNPSQSWVNGDTLQIATVAHELGHAFGLWHSHLLNCGTTIVVGSNCAITEYGDIVDVMGASQPAAPNYNAFQKERLGWLNYGASPSIQTVTTSGTYTINPYEVADTGPNALKVLKSSDPTTGAKTWYYIEARQGLGFDSFLTDGTCGNCWNQTVTNGVLVHTGTDGDGNSSDLLDMTPSTATYYWSFDPALAVGQSFQDSTTGLTIIPISVSSTSAMVQITVNGSSCTPANPSVSISPSQSQSVTSGTPVNLTITVTDNDSSGCSAATFNLGSSVPSGWAGLWNAGGLILSPGKSGSATLSVTSPTGTADGSYNISVTAINASAGSYNGSASATYLINTTPVNISLTTNQPSYLPGQIVGVIVTMASGTSPDVGASVAVTVTSPNGRKTTLSGTTGSNGVALLNYKLSKRATPGTYQAQYGTSLTGAASVTGASTSFTVQ
jgi:M6 family metalloprotease-like protein